MTDSLPALNDKFLRINMSLTPIPKAKHHVGSVGPELGAYDHHIKFINGKIYKISACKSSLQNSPGTVHWQRMVM